MKNIFLEHLKTLSKEELINLIYKPYTKFLNIKHNSYRTIALRISYDGTKYTGLSEYKFGDTIGNRIKNALLMSTLGENIVYAGRTDKGVSAINMIASLKVKSMLLTNTNRYFILPEDEKEFDYQTILNNYLPNDIQITGWAPVEENFNARFSCIQRQYRYYFCIQRKQKYDVYELNTKYDNNKINTNYDVNEISTNYDVNEISTNYDVNETNTKYDVNEISTNYDVNEMNKMCQTIKKMTNFYYLSKHSDKNARYNRTVDICQIVKDDDLYYLDVQAKSFLHNMVRKIFWLVEKAGLKEDFAMEKIGTADPANLIFYRAVYPVNLQFIKKQAHEQTVKKNYNFCDVKHKIQKLIFESQD